VCIYLTATYDLIAGYLCHIRSISNVLTSPGSKLSINSLNKIWVIIQFYYNKKISRWRKKEKQSLVKPGHTLRVLGGWGSEILRQLAHEGGKDGSPTQRPPLPHRKYSCTHFCQRLSRPQGHSAAGKIMSTKNSNDTIGNRTRYLLACTNKSNRSLLL
jgi:hypothetical protein